MAVAKLQEDMPKMWHEFVTVTPDMAVIWLKEMRFKGQRAFYNSHLLNLIQAMKENRFYEGSQIFVAVLPDGTMKILNGYHRLRAVVESKLEQVFSIVYKCVINLKEAGDLYGAFDNHKKRTACDVARGKDIQIPSKNIISIGAAIRAIISSFYQTGSQRMPVDLNVITDMMSEEYADSIAAYLEITITADKAKNGVCRWVRSGSVVAIMLTTLKYESSKIRAIEFWTRFAKDDGLTSGMPEKALLNYLRSDRDTRGSDERRRLCTAAACAWNAFWNERTISHLKPEAVKNFCILGTPFERGL